MPDLHLHRFGPADGPTILALHGLTGHGRRWESLAVEQLPEARILAPDLRGHGRSPSAPPWSFEAHVADLRALLATESAAPALVVGHSFGGAVALHLAHHHPDLVRGLVLLDPAIALDPFDLLDVAYATLDSPDYTDAEEAKAEKVHGAWADVPESMIDAELAEHLVPTSNGRVGWRMSLPAITAFWGELARDFVLPPAAMRTVLVQAMRVQPPYVTAKLRSALQSHLGAALEVHELDCNHMVSQAQPAEVARLIRRLL
ncbi:alpha/beta hydrolase [Aldersonia sp. NBC_00410]|uniref:alpha/beta fold hydrolase n=1 Tax=Aldersonia sp. NBC_00410 TaxID=2975954 RepID=UPI002253FD67|nr:alpha/beta hydrolase [Aldersonia sp. NBC_00410]MCX5044592.1 alpha/beta hydrolase [Aldersonia sp. NBC_00410]